MSRDWSRCVRAVGPWVYVRPHKLDGREKFTIKSLKTGLFMPTGTSAQRMSPNFGTVVSVGHGFWDEDRQLWDNLGLRPGVVVWYKGYQEQLNRPHHEVDDFSFLHMRDLLGYDPSIVELTPNRVLRIKDVANV